MPTLTPDDLENVPHPNPEVSFDDMDIEEVVKVHYQAWFAVEKRGVYGSSDMERMLKAESALQEREVEFEPKFPQYYVPKRSM